MSSVSTVNLLLDIGDDQLKEEKFQAPLPSMECLGATHVVAHMEGAE